MPETPEAQARKEVDRLLEAADWHVCEIEVASILPTRRVALCELSLAEGHEFAECLLYMLGNAAGVIEAKSAWSVLCLTDRPIPTL